MSSSSSRSSSSRPITKEQLKIEKRWRGRYIVLDKIELQGREFPSDMLINDLFKNILEFADAETHRNVFCTSKRTMSYYHYMGRNLFHNLKLALNMSDLIYSHKKCSLWSVMLPHVEQLKIYLYDHTDYIVPKNLKCTTQAELYKHELLKKYHKTWLSTKIQEQNGKLLNFDEHTVSILKMKKLKNLFIKGRIDQLTEILSQFIGLAPQLESFSIHSITYNTSFTGAEAPNFYDFRSKCVNLKHFYYKKNDPIYTSYPNETFKELMGEKICQAHPKLESLELINCLIGREMSDIGNEPKLKRFVLRSRMFTEGLDPATTKFSREFQEGLEYLDTTSTILPTYFEASYLKNLRELHLNMRHACPLPDNLVLPSVEILTMYTNNVNTDLISFPNLKHFTCKRETTQRCYLGIESSIERLDSITLEDCDLELVEPLDPEKMKMGMYADRCQCQILKFLLSVKSVSLLNCKMIGIYTLEEGDKRYFPENKIGLELLHENLNQKFALLVEDGHKDR